MKKIVLIFGSIVGFVCIGMFFLNLPNEGQEAMDFEYGELIGYLTMIIALSSIFFAVKQYRDKHLGGSIKFGTAFLMGLYITLVASVIYVVAWEIYYRNYGLEFGDQYTAYLKSDMAEQGMSEADIQKEMDAHADTMEMYQNNMAFRMLVTLTEIFPVGLVISLICALIFGVFIKNQPQESTAELA